MSAKQKDTSDIEQSESDSQPTKRKIGRRTFIKGSTVGILGTAAISGRGLPDTIEPVDDADALAVTGAAIIGAAVVGVAAGLAYERYVAEDDETAISDIDDAVDDNARVTSYDHVYGVVNSSIQLRVEELNRYAIGSESYLTSNNDIIGLDTVSAKSDAEIMESDAADVVWDSVRAAVRQGIADEKDQVDIEIAAEEAMKKRVTEMIVERVVRWNKMAEGLGNVLARIVGRGLYDTKTTGGYVPSTTNDGYLYDIPDSNDGIFEMGKVDLPVPITDIEKYDSSDVGELNSDGNENKIEMIHDGSNIPIGDGPGWSTDHDANPPNQTYHISDPDTDREVSFLNASVSGAINQNLSTIYSTVLNDIPEYVDKVTTAVDNGNIDVADLAGPGELVSDIDSTESENARLARELSALGVNITDSNEMTISHPSLDGERTGVLFLDSSTDFTLKEGETVAASDYDEAYLMTDADNAISLDPSEPIEIIELDRVEGVISDPSTTGGVETVDGSESVVISDSDVLDLPPRKYTVEVTDSSGSTASIPLEDFDESSDGSQISHPLPSSLSDVSSVDVVGSLNGDADNPNYSVDPTVDEATIRSRNEELVAKNEELQELLEEEQSGVIGGVGGIGGLDLSDNRVIAGIVVLGGGVLAALGLSGDGN